MRLALILLGAWVLLCVLFEVALVTWQRSVIQEDLERESRTLISLLSQRVDQHDAHMTSLSALSQVGVRPDRSLFLEVAAAIQRFYPRVAAMDLVSVDPLDESSEPLITTRTTGDQSNVTASAIRQAAIGSQGELVLLKSPVDSQRYLLIKRSPNNNQARFFLSLEIDTDTLLSERSDYWRNPNLSLKLSLPDGTELSNQQGSNARYDTPGGIEDNQTAIPDKVIDKNSPVRARHLPFALFNTQSDDGQLSSRTQPLGLTAHLTLDVFDLLPLPLSIGGPIALALLLGLSVLIYRLVRRTKTAELQASLSVNEARISHASRVNSLGEMASGMAHELTQPLTAVLSQSQAGLRILDRPDADVKRLKKVLDANVTQAKRASEILSRLRNWSTRKTHKTTIVSINESIANVIALVEHDASRQSVAIEFVADVCNPLVNADAIEIEQVVFNLVRNALESYEPENHPLSPSSDISAPVDRQNLITIHTQQHNGDVRIVIKDNGRGITKELRDRLFEPFTTNKPDGMGLGLALCARIVERYHGSIEVMGNDRQGAVATIVLPAHIQ